jgi:hypothetical protein
VPERSNIDPAITAAARRPRERLIPNPKARLREQFHEVCRFRHLSERTEEAYWGWVRRFLVWARDQGSTESRPTGLATGGAWRHPRDLGGFIFGGHPGVIPPATFRPASGLRSGALPAQKQFVDTKCGVAGTKKHFSWTKCGVVGTKNGFSWTKYADVWTQKRFVGTKCGMVWTQKRFVSP